MTYQWKIPTIPVDANAAGNELNRICQKNNGNLLAKDVVEESRPETAVLHNCFEWNDAVAAERFREVQAGNIIRNITVVHDEDEVGKESVEIRAFVSVQKSYQPIQVIVNDQEKMSELLSSALRELNAFRTKYSVLTELSDIFNSIQKIVEKVG